MMLNDVADLIALGFMLLFALIAAWVLGDMDREEMGG